jgi:fructokinase
MISKEQDHRETLSLDTNKHSIAIFGEVLADVFPEETVLGGAPYNVARHLQAFGQHPLLITRTGNDALRDEFINEMFRLGMDDSGVQCDQLHPTGQVIVHINGLNHNFEILPEQAYDHIHAGLTHFATMQIHPEIVYFGTLAQRSLESRLSLDIFLNDTKGYKFLDINLREPWYDKHIIKRSLLRANIVKLNEDELKIIANMLKLSGTTVRDYAFCLIEKFDLVNLIVTCGESGAWMVGQDGKETKVLGKKLNGAMVDTVGAGDGFAAVCILGILENWSNELILTKANSFAAAICGIRGAAPLNHDFYLPFMDDKYGREKAKSNG